MKLGASEAFSRILIDKALEASGWNLLDPHQLWFELSGTGRRAGRLCFGRSAMA